MRAPRLAASAAACTLLALSACAVAPNPPVDAIASAQTALHQAEQARVGDESELELNEARSKLTQAQTIAADRNAGGDRMKSARQLADEARVNAELATAKSVTARQQMANAEMQKTIDVMRFETQRSTSTGPYDSNQQ